MRVAKGNINTVLKSLEDPEKIMNQAMVDMQNDLTKIRQSYSEITASQRRLSKQKDEAQSVADNWYRRAQLALKNDNGSLAREALARRQVELELVKDLQAQIDTQANSVDKLYEGMNALENKILEARAKKDQFAARAKTAKSTQQVNDMLSGLTGKTSMDAFKRMEEKVEALEAAAEVSAEMGHYGAAALPGTSDVEKEFALLEASSAVDDELKRMKKVLAGSTDSHDSKQGASKSASYLDIL